MKTAISFNTVNRETSGPGAFMRAAKWYWDEVTDMAAAAGFTSLALPMLPSTPNIARNGAPICTDEIRNVYGSAEGYLSYLNEKGIENVAAIMISAQGMFDSMFESGVALKDFFTEFRRHAEDVCGMLKTLGGSVLVVSPTPAIGPLAQALGGEDKLAGFAEESARCISEIGAMSAAMGVRTCLKNDFWTLARGNEIHAFMEKVDRSVVGFAPDTAQLKIAGADYTALVREYADNLACVCLTDTNYSDQTDNYKSISPEYPQSGPQQRCYHDLGYGSVDFPAVYQTLQDTGFDGLVILESRHTLDVPKSILRMRTFWSRLTK